MIQNVVANLGFHVNIIVYICVCLHVCCGFSLASWALSVWALPITSLYKWCLSCWRTWWRQKRRRKKSKGFPNRLFYKLLVDLHVLAFISQRLNGVERGRTKQSWKLPIHILANTPLSWLFGQMHALIQLYDNQHIQSLTSTRHVKKSFESSHDQQAFNDHFYMFFMSHVWIFIKGESRQICI